VSAPATGTAASLALPIAGGRLAIDDLAGTVEHDGGVALTSGGRAVDLTQPTITFSDTPQLGVSYAGAPVALADATVGGRPVLDPDRRTVAVTLSAARLTAAGAATLNRALAKSGFGAGARIATARLTARAR